MGMFDTAIVRCPRCAYPNEMQSKAGDCELKEWELHLAPTVVQADIANKFNDFQCANCAYIGKIIFQTVIQIL